MEKSELGGDVDSGFVNLENISRKGEKEILFNAIKVFEVEEVNHKKISIDKDERYFLF